MFLCLIFLKLYYFEEDIYNAVDLMNCVNKRDVIGGPSKRQVEFQIAKFEKWLKI